MAGRPTDWHLVGRDKDPTPGNPEVLRDWERYFRRRSDDAENCMDQLRNIQGGVNTLDLEGSWITAIWGRTDYLAADLLPEKTCHGEVADALKAFRQSLADLQSSADAGLAMARKAVEDRNHASAGLQAQVDRNAAAGDSSGVCAPVSSADIGQRTMWQGKLDDANGRLAAAKNIVDTAAENFGTAANQVVMALKDAEDVLGNTIFRPTPPDRNTTKPAQPSFLSRYLAQATEDLYGLAAITAGTLKGADSVGMNLETMMMFGGPEGGGPGSEFALADGTTSTGLADAYAFGQDPFKEYDVGEGQLDELWLKKNWKDYPNKWTKNGPKPPQLRPVDPAEEEALNGHTIDRHIGKTDQFLRDRIKNEGIEAASTYTSYTEADVYMNLVADERKTEIETWLKSGKAATQEFWVEFPGAQIGRRITSEELAKGINPHPVDQATIVLKRDPSAPDGYYVVTSFPGPPN